MNLTGITFFCKRSLRHTKHDSSTTVVENHQVVVSRVDAETFDFTAAAEIVHLTEQFNTAGLRACGNLSFADFRFAVLIELNAERSVLNYFRAVFQASELNFADIGNIDIVWNLIH